MLWIVKRFLRIYKDAWDSLRMLEITKGCMRFSEDATDARKPEEMLGILEGCPVKILEMLKRYSEILWDSLIFSGIL